MSKLTRLFTSVLTPPIKSIINHQFYPLVREFLKLSSLFPLNNPRLWPCVNGQRNGDGFSHDNFTRKSVGNYLFILIYNKVSRRRNRGDCY